MKDEYGEIKVKTVAELEDELDFMDDMIHDLVDYVAWLHEKYNIAETRVLH